MRDWKRPKANTFVAGGSLEARGPGEFRCGRSRDGSESPRAWGREFAGQWRTCRDMIAALKNFGRSWVKRMRNWIVLCAALLMIASAKPVFAAMDVTGTWTGSLTTPDGSNFPLSFTFKQDGAKVTGTVTTPQGDPIPIDNGKIDGDKFTFDTSFNGMTISHVCTVDGDEMKVSTKTDNDQVPPMEFTLKRGAAAAPAAPDAPKADAPKPQA
jgi:hypothetical protein